MATEIVAILSVQPKLNMLSPTQIMNISFDPLDLVNTHGAFGTVGQERLNVVFEGTADADSTEYAHWQPYRYKGLPVALDKRPPQIAPYQLRLDWQMWFASMAAPADYLWTYNLTWKLLHNNSNAMQLFANNPFATKPPRYIRAVICRYYFAPPSNAKGLWWTRRERLSLCLPPMSFRDTDLQTILRSKEWIH